MAIEPPEQVIGLAQTWWRLKRLRGSRTSKSEQDRLAIAEQLGNLGWRVHTQAPKVGKCVVVHVATGGVFPVERNWDVAPLAIARGPYKVSMPGRWTRAGSLIAADASVNDGYAGWAAVRNDGMARVGWFSAAKVDSVGAEMEALRQAMHLADRGQRLITDNQGVFRYVQHLRDGAAPDDLPVSLLQPELATAFAADLAASTSRISLVTSGGRAARSGAARTRSPRHYLLEHADRLAWATLHLAHDGIDITADVADFLGGFRGTKHNRLKQYQRWRGQRGTPE